MARPSAGGVLERLKQVAHQVGQPPYVPPEMFEHSVENEVSRWQNWAITYKNLGLYNFDLYEDALARIDRAVALAPTDPDVLMTRGNILARLNRSDEALRVYDQILAALPPDDVRRRKEVGKNQGDPLMNLGRYAEAEAVYAQALVMQRHDVAIWYNRAFNQRAWAIAEAKEGHRDAELTHLRDGVRYAEQAVALNPKNPQLHRLLDVLQDALREARAGLLDNKSVGCVV